jgi:hypothetical protein
MRCLQTPKHYFLSCGHVKNYFHVPNNFTKRACCNLWEIVFFLVKLFKSKGGTYHEIIQNTVKIGVQTTYPTISQYIIM